MKKNKLLVCIVLALVVCLCFVLGACQQTEEPEEPKVAKQREIYNLYVEYATAAGEDVLSYEDWLESVRGADGSDGQNGKDGSMWYTGEGEPQSDAPAQAKQGDLYLDTSNGYVYQKQTDGSWQQVTNITGPQGPQGQQGQQGGKGDEGPEGQNGKDGSMWYTGEGEPQSDAPAQAKQGDLYLDTSNGYVYQKQADGSWQQIADITGPQGQQGQQGQQGVKGQDGSDGQNGKDGQDGQDGKDGQNGTDGKDGSMWYTGSGEPQSDALAQAKQGDLYLETSNGYVYQKQADGSWQQIANLTGPQGEQGQQGQDGATGQQGDKGEQGPAGQDGKDGQDGADGQDGTDGKDGLSAYDIFKKYYPFYQGDEEQWIADLVNGNLTIYKVTFKSEVAEDIVRRVFIGQDLTDIPEVPEKEGQASAKWDREDFTNITEDIEVHAVYTMQQFTVTFHNPFREEEDVTRTVSYGEELTDIPTITPIADNDAYWDVTDFSRITEDMTVNAVYETQGLQYTLINSQQEYRVSAGTMNKEAEELFIPAYHDGKPVTVIAEKGFASENGNFSFKFAHLPETLTEIRDSAFWSCISLQSIIIPSNVTAIGGCAFAFCKALTSVTMTNVKEIGQQSFVHCESLHSIEMPNIITIGHTAFGDCSSLTEVYMPNVTEIGYEAFSNCTALEHLEIPSGVTKINFGLFEGCTALKYVILPSGITSIGIDIFKGCSVFEAIYFKGNAQEWEALDKSDAGGVFNDAMVYFYEPTAPQETGNYWHYDVDEKTPIVWNKED